MESRISGGLSCLDDFLLNTLIQVHSETAPETTRNTILTNQGTKDEDSQSEPHPEAGISQNQTTNSGLWPRWHLWHTFTEVATFFGLRKSAQSLFKIKEVLNKFGLNTISYTRDRNCSTKDGFGNLHVFGRKYWKTYTNEDLFVSYGCRPSKLMTNHIYRRNRTFFHRI